jgi:magnesium transporter
MVNVIYRSEVTGFTWVDVSAPTRPELEQLTNEYALAPTAVEDCLQPFHLPKFENLANFKFVILRAFDERLSGQRSSSIQEMTRKLAIFFSESHIITIHRGDMAFFSCYRDQWLAQHIKNEQHPITVLFALMNAAISTYEPPLRVDEAQMDRYEYEVFNENSKAMDFRSFYELKRNLALMKKMLRLTQDVLLKMDPIYTREFHTHFQDVKENADVLLLKADELINEGQALMGMYINISAHKNNEIIRVLTIFSVFFLPLTFVVGVYGMNFKFMPELEQPLGYPLTWAFMVLVVLGIYIWFRRNRWL